MRIYAINKLADSGNPDVISILLRSLRRHGAPHFNKKSNTDMLERLERSVIEQKLRRFLDDERAAEPLLAALVNEKGWGRVIAADTLTLYRSRGAIDKL